MDLLVQPDKSKNIPYFIKIRQIPLHQINGNAYDVFFTNYTDNISTAMSLWKICNIHIFTNTHVRIHATDVGTLAFYIKVVSTKFISFHFVIIIYVTVICRA